MKTKLDGETIKKLIEIEPVKGMIVIDPKQLGIGDKIPVEKVTVIIQDDQQKYLEIVQYAVTAIIAAMAALGYVNAA